MKRRTHANPMRLLIMLAVFWAAGSLLFAADGFLARTKSAAQAPAPTVPAGESIPVARLAAEEGPVKPSNAAAPAESSAEEAPKEEDSKEETAAASPEEGPPEEDTEAIASEEPASAESKSAADAGASPRRFVPSEQVRADFDVSFPIDI